MVPGCTVPCAGDFDVPASREDVDRDSLWNQWLRSEMHSLFVDALQRFKVRVLHQQSYPVWVKFEENVYGPP